MLIVCEGKKTEPRYFNALVADHAIKTAVVVTSGKYSDPRSVVSDAIEKRDADGDFDAAYAVFDLDTPNVAEAQADARAQNVVVIGSEPCFEYWLLLHFSATGRRFGQGGSDSPCAEVMRELRKELPSYDKGDGSTYDAISEYTDQAIGNAQRRSGKRYSTTHVHTLVEKLRGLRDG